MKKELTPSQMLEKREKQIKWLKILKPIIQWGSLALAIIFLIIAFKESFGNMSEIINMLDGKLYNDAELQANYEFLLQKYGEWIIGSGNSGFIITFVNVGRAMFSGLMITSLIGSIIMFVTYSIIGKKLLPKIIDKLKEDNQTMTNKAILKNIEEIK